MSPNAAIPLAARGIDLNAFLVVPFSAVPPIRYFFLLHLLGQGTNGFHEAKAVVRRDQRFGSVRVS